MKKRAFSSIPFSNLFSTKKAGEAPGTLIYTGSQPVTDTKCTLIRYNDQGVERYDSKSIDELLPTVQPGMINWLTIEGLHDIETIQKVGSHFKIDPLVLEDILNVKQLPKSETIDDHLFVAMRLLHYDKEKERIINKQMSLVVGDDLVILMLESKSHVFNPIIERIKNNLGKVRKQKADYLFYRLIDTAVDHYIEITNMIEISLDTFQDELLLNPKKSQLEVILNYKKELSHLNKAVLPFDEVFHQLQDTNPRQINKLTQLMLNDVNDHLRNTLTSLKSLREMVSVCIDIHMTNISNKMNEVMKTLTIIATIFIPLTFIAGIYGMNFENIPELKWKYGYFGVLSIMFLLIIIMLFIMKRRKWF